MRRVVALFVSLFAVACSPAPYNLDGGADQTGGANLDSAVESPNANACPAAAPSPGDPCSMPVTCNFDGHCGIRIISVCEDGVWRDVYNLTKLRSGCGGAELSTCREAQTCQSHTGCIAVVAKDTSAYYDCNAGGVLTLVSKINGPAESTCPATPPVAGSGCTSDPPGGCAYQGRCGVAMATRCEGGHWIVRYDLLHLMSPCAGAELATCTAGQECTAYTECWTPVGSTTTMDVFTCDDSGHLQLSANFPYGP